MNFFKSKYLLRTNKKPLVSDKYNDYLILPEKRPSAKYRLFCFPCAGGNASAYNAKWSADLPKTIEYIAVQLPGRQTRAGEEFITDMHQLTSNIVDAMHDLIADSKKPYAFFGHSLGTVIAYETALEIRRRGLPLPLQLFLAGRGAPGFPDPVPQNVNCDLPDEEFANICLEMFGPSVGLLDHRLHSVTIPPLRADLQMYYKYSFNYSEETLGIPIVVFGATGDPLSQEHVIRTWEQFSRTHHHIVVPARNEEKKNEEKENENNSESNNNNNNNNNNANSESESECESNSDSSSVHSVPSSNTPITLTRTPSNSSINSTHSTHTNNTEKYNTHANNEEKYKISSPPFQVEMVDVAMHQFLNEWRFKETLSKHLSHLVVDLMDDVWC